MVGDLRQTSFVSHFFLSWIQQNHDGLPQKAGLPQHRINEIHGALYDPGNPVVQFNGGFRAEPEWRDLQGAVRKADLVLVLGTTISHMNADQVFFFWMNMKLFSVASSPQVFKYEAYLV